MFNLYMTFLINNLIFLKQLLNHNLQKLYNYYVYLGQFNWNIFRDFLWNNINESKEVIYAHQLGFLIKKDNNYYSIDLEKQIYNQ